MAKNSKSTHAKALQVLTRLQKALLRRLADYVLENEATLRQAADGAEEQAPEAEKEPEADTPEPEEAPGNEPEKT